MIEDWFRWQNWYDFLVYFARRSAIKKGTNVILVRDNTSEPISRKLCFYLSKSNCIHSNDNDYQWKKISVKHTKAWWNCLHIFFCGIKRIRFERKTKEKEGKTGSQNRIRVRVWSTVVSAYIVSWRWSWSKRSLDFFQMKFLLLPQYAVLFLFRLFI